MPYKFCVSTSTFLATPFPPDMCAGTWTGVCPHLKTCGRSHHLWSPPCPCHDTGMVQSSVCAGFGSGFICTPSLPLSPPLPAAGLSKRSSEDQLAKEALLGGDPPTTHQCLFLQSRHNLALHSEQAQAVSPSPKPPGDMGTGPMGLLGCRLGPAAGAWGIRTPCSVIPTQLGKLRRILSASSPRLGSGSGLWSTLVAPGTAVCAACRGRAIPSLLQSHSAAPTHRHTNHRGNPWVQQDWGPQSLGVPVGDFKA